MILRVISAALLVFLLVPLYFAGIVLGLAWMGLVAGWKSVDMAVNWMLGDTHVWKVTVRREAKKGGQRDMSDAEKWRESGAGE